MYVVYDNKKQTILHLIENLVYFSKMWWLQNMKDKVSVQGDNSPYRKVQGMFF